MMTKKPDVKNRPVLSEEECRKKWEQEKTYFYQENPPAEKKTFVIDTPPPTLSGTLHIGHIFSYTQTDILARFQRMRGRNVFYPMGWDNNGLPTEKRVSQLYHIVCRSDRTREEELKNFSGQQGFSKSHAPSELKQKFLKHLLSRRDTFSQSKKKKSSPPLGISRESFIPLCRWQTAEDQRDYKKLWQRMALSIDWRYTYETISPFCQALSQRSFLDLYQKGYVENRFSPVYWDTQFQTAVAQADIEDRQREGFYYNIVFQLREGGQKEKPSLVISTTRPELLPACVALVAHPEDERYRKFFHQQALSPLFHAPVPVLPSEHADPEKGTGLLMVCTFGDREDVEFWKKTLRGGKAPYTEGGQASYTEAGKIPLPLRSVIGWDGKIKPLKRGWLSLKDLKPDFLSADSEGQEESFFSLNPEKAQAFYSRLEGLSVFQARVRIVELLKEEQALRGEPQPTKQFVKFYEKGSRALELLPTRQWYIKLLEHKQDFLRQGQKIQWHPPSMFKRYEQWVEGLNEDWCISRQRFFGVPFPVWYPVTSEGRVEEAQPLFAPPEACPVDPLSQAPADVIKGSPYTGDRRDRPGGFTAQNQVMDTWATSSLSPQINSHWGTNKERHKKLFPADLRPQAHEIIRTWAFYTIAKSFFHERKIPWRKTAISGWVMDPQRLKMSKSRGKALLPEELLKKYPADALRYWAGKAALGQDTVYDENRVKAGRKLVVKLSNAFRFVQMLFPGEAREKGGGDFKLEWVDRAWLHGLWGIHQRAKDLLENFQYSEALNVVEKGFWLFCDNYIELVKPRGYQMSEKPEGLSALHTLDFSCYLFLKMLAPFLPYVTEQLWQERYKEDSASVHASSWDQCLLGKRDCFHRLGEEALSCEEAFRGCLSCGGEEAGGVKDESANPLPRELLDMAFEVLRDVRSEKSSQGLGLSTPVKGLKIYGGKNHRVLFEFLRRDVALSARGREEEVVFVPHPSGGLKVQITL